MIAGLSADVLDVEIYDQLAILPHFNPDLDREQPPAEVEKLRQKVQEADGVIICTPEYVFSLPGALKNAIEWMVSTTVFSEKPVALITAAAAGEKAHESLLLIMKTLYTQLGENSALLIQGVRSKVNAQGEITDEETSGKISVLLQSFLETLQRAKDVKTETTL